MFDLLIINGTIPDFDTENMIKTNIGITDGKIEYVGNDIKQAVRVIDAEDRIVSPGFIDIHMHEDDFTSDKNDFFTSLSMLKMGVTTALGGNCGTQHQRLSDFIDNIDNHGGAPVNYMMLAGYNNFRQELGIGHYDSADKNQMDYIRQKCLEEIRNGARGISFGIEYDPGITDEEILYACDIISDERMLVSAHLRADCIDDTDSIKEAVYLSENINAKFQVSHLVSTAAMSGKKLMNESLSILNNAIEKNTKLDYDTYPYRAFSTLIGSTVFDDGCFEKWNKSYGDIMMTDAPYKNMCCTEEIFNDCRENHPEMYAVAFVMNEDEVTRAITNKNGMIASDGIVRNHRGHPRAAGTFPRILAKYVREENAVDMITALYKMTAKPADRLNLKYKGKIKKGCDADIVIFNPVTIKDKADFTHLEGAEGIDYVIVNGKISLVNGEVLSDKNGRFIPYSEAIR